MTMNLITTTKDSFISNGNIRKYVLLVYKYQNETLRYLTVETNREHDY